MTKRKNTPYFGDTEEELQQHANRNILKGYFEIISILKSKESKHEQVIAILNKVKKASYGLAHQVNKFDIDKDGIKTSKRRHTTAINSIHEFGANMVVFPFPDEQPLAKINFKPWLNGVNNKTDED